MFDERSSAVLPFRVIVLPLGDQCGPERCGSRRVLAIEGRRYPMVWVPWRSRVSVEIRSAYREGWEEAEGKPSP